MSEWHGYEQRKGAHGSRPWWRIKEPRLGTKYWVRSDGLTAPFEATDVTLAALGRSKPLPAPPPKLMQVWVLSPGRVRMVLAVDFGARPDAYNVGWSWKTHMACYGPDAEAWPPPGAVLVAGPHSPWAPE